MPPCSSHHKEGMQERGCTPCDDVVQHVLNTGSHAGSFESKLKEIHQRDGQDSEAAASKPDRTHSVAREC